jgi:hypothetical protein
MSWAIGFLVAAFALGVALLVWGIYLLLKRPKVNSAAFYPEYPQAQVIIKKTVIRAAVADSVATRTQGLSGRAAMKPDEAMLFIFPTAARYSFWMKDMMFPLDMVWIRNGRVVDISVNVPSPEPNASILRSPRVKPATPADSLLEVNAGLAARHGWKTGDEVRVII